MLKWQVPVQWHQGAAYLMNQQTFALVQTMSDAMGRPLMLPSPVAPGQWLVNGSPVYLNTFMPDAVPGATPVAFGNWRQVYVIVIRRGITSQPRPFFRRLLYFAEILGARWRQCCLSVGGSFTPRQVTCSDGW